MRNTRSIIIIGISSDIGLALARRWLKRGWKIFGTYRKKSPAIKELEDSRVGLVSCDTSTRFIVEKNCTDAGFNEKNPYIKTSDRQKDQ